MRLISLTLLLLFTAPAYANEYHRAAVDRAPKKIPDRIVLTWSGDPTTTASVTWRTDTSISQAEGQIAEANASANFTTWARNETARTEKWKRNRLAAHFHSVTFKGLKPNTLYAYRVGSDKIWSSWYQFRTASAEPDEFTFIYLGDAQNNLLALWARTIRTAVLDAPHADFIIHAGDLVNNANRDSDWHEWFESGNWIHAKIPSIPSPGNHEYSNYQDVSKRRLSVLWRPQFTLPENGPEGFAETTYYTDYQGARIISLNSNERHKEQAPWLEQVLKNNPNKWTFVTFHHPVYAASGGLANKDQREAWKPIFDKYAVDLVLQGHNHTYARGNNIGNGVTVRDSTKGTVYVVSVSGPKQLKLRKDRWMTRGGENTQLYQIITVSDDTLHYRAMTAVGELYDAFDLVKQMGKPNKLIDRAPQSPERRWENTLKKKNKDDKVY
ncbi:MAG: metallophosphoesterase family protein [Gemmatimonadetes bacterium]|nr:metallophosphoesterase family protein [Gemmatimonadota bacterium]